MKRKLLAILLIVCLVISIAPAALAAGYDDTDGHWAEGSIERWAVTVSLKASAMASSVPTEP